MAEEKNLLAQLKTDLISAMKAGDKRQVETLRMLTADIQKEEIAKTHLLNQDETLAILKRGIKTRQESIAQFEKGNRQDLVQKESEQIEIIKKYLPSPLEGAALKKIVEDTIASLKISSKKEMGLVMKAILGKFGSQVNGKEVQTLVSERLV